MQNYKWPSALTTLALFTLTGCSSAPEAEGPVVSTPGPSASQTQNTPMDAAGPTQVEVIAENLNAPWSVVFVDQTALISERDTAGILELDENGGTRELTVVADTSAGGEGGLLGLAVHESHLYAYLTTASDNRVLRYELAGEPGNLALGSPEVILDGIPAAGYHNGGRIAFGPDGLLYITTGDAQEPSESQDLESLAGKILRVTDEGDIPPDNPFEDSPVYSYGHRNPQGIAWSAGGTLYSGEFGENAWDELNVIEPGGNYGWPEVEGIGEEEEFINPVQQWQPAEASPSAIEIHNDTIVMAALRGQRLWQIPLADVTTSTDYLTNEYGRIRDVITAPDGSLWVLTNNTDGVGEPTEGDDRILRIEVPSDS